MPKGFQPGNKLAVGHGRPKGATSIRKDVIEACFADFNPLENLKKLALSCAPPDTLFEPDVKYKQEDREMYRDCNKILAEYFAPKLKAIEHTGDINIAMSLHVDFISHLQDAEEQLDAERELNEAV